MIFSLYLRLSLVLIILTTAVILLVCTQLHDHTELQALLTPTRDCPMPCFIGIRPGITTDQEAYRLLYSSGWTQDLTFRGEFYTPPMTWKWSSAAPAIFQPTERPYDGSLRIQGGIVQHIELRTHIDLGDAVLNWGTPDRYTLLATTGGPIGGPPPPRPFVFVYPDMAILVPTQCIYLRRLWTTNTTIIIGDPAAWLDNFIPLDPSGLGQPMMRFVAETTWYFCGTL
jgi:hypothetical protein